MNNHTRRTRQRELIWQALQKQRRFASSQQIHAWLHKRGHQIGLATVYRSLKAWHESGRLDAIRGLDNQMLFRICAGSDHHHHLVCTECGDALEVASKELENSIKRIARNKRFRLASHEVEIFGRCERCTN